MINTTLTFQSPILDIQLSTCTSLQILHRVLHMSYWCPLPSLSPPEYRKFFLQKIRSSFTVSVYSILAIGYVGVLISGLSNRSSQIMHDHGLLTAYGAWYDIWAPIVMICILIPQLIFTLISSLGTENDARKDRRFNDAVIILTRITQFCAIVLCVIRIILAMSETVECAAQSATGLRLYQINCTTNANEMNLYHADARGSVMQYSVSVLFPIMLSLHMIPVKTVILPLVVILTIINIIITTDYVPNELLSSCLTFPIFASAAVMSITYRAEYHALKNWQDRFNYIKEKEKWLATVAHNIGTPLTTISFAATAMWNLKNIKDTKIYLKQQRVAVDYLRGVYTTVMYSQSGKRPEYKQQRFKITTLLKACEDMTKTYGNSLFPNVGIKYILDTKLPIYCVSDWAKIQQCVVNLVSNAQKHTQKMNNNTVTVNSNTVTVKFLKYMKQLRIEVCDSSSIGVDNVLVDRYFTKEGTGLGSVCLLVESMHGTYGGYSNKDNATNNETKGSTFFISLPLQDNIELEVLHDNDHIALTKSWDMVSGENTPDITCTSPPRVESKEIQISTTAATSSTTTSSKSKLQILLVEDVSINREFIKLWLNSEFPGKLNIVEASNGKEALEQYSEAIEGRQPFDVVLLDIFMPVMGGFACLEEIVKKYGKKRPPVIAITTSSPEDENNSKVRFDGWWDKCDQQAMVKGMSKVIENVEKM